MLLKAGALSLALLLVSRLLGLLRESALAATFGTSGLADVAVLMLTLPDWLAGVLASGALAYVLLPAWAAQSPVQIAASQRRVARLLIGLAVVLAIALVLLREQSVAWLAGGLPPPLRAVAGQAMLWTSLALPAAFLAALWTTRLQQERDFVGMYSSGIVVNVALLAAIAGAALGAGGEQSVAWLGAGLVAAMVLRLAWQRTRQPRTPHRDENVVPAVLPGAPVWLWALLSAGLPLALPFAARSMASHSGEGALATFNYAWKLVELPLLLAIQLVATLALPAIAQALSADRPATAAADADRPVRTAFALAFALACACAAGLLAAAPALTHLLFGWGRMDAQALVRVAQWARIGAWGLLPQALIAVALAVLAAQRRMKGAVMAYAFALLTFLAIGAGGLTDGSSLMATLNVLLAIVAVVMLVAIGPAARRWLPWGVLCASFAALLLLALGMRFVPAPAADLPGLAVGGSCVGLVLAAAWLAASAGGLTRSHNSRATHD